MKKEESEHNKKLWVWHVLSLRLLVVLCNASLRTKKNIQARVCDPRAAGEGGDPACKPPAGCGEGREEVRGPVVPRGAGGHHRPHHRATDGRAAGEGVAPGGDRMGLNGTEGDRRGTEGTEGNRKDPKGIEGDRRVPDREGGAEDFSADAGKFSLSGGKKC